MARVPNRNIVAYCHSCGTDRDVGQAGELVIEYVPHPLTMKMARYHSKRGHDVRWQHGGIVRQVQIDHAQRYPDGCRGTWSSMCEACAERLAGRETTGQYINRERAAFLRKPAAPTALEEAQADARELMDDARREMAEEDYDRS